MKRGGGSESNEKDTASDVYFDLYDLPSIGNLVKYFNKKFGLKLDAASGTVKTKRKLQYLRDKIYFSIGSFQSLRQLSQSFPLSFQDFETLLMSGEQGRLDQNTVSYLLFINSRRYKKYWNSIVIHADKASVLLKTFESKNLRNSGLRDLKAILTEMPETTDLIFVPLLYHEHFVLILCDLGECKIFLLNSLPEMTINACFTALVTLVQLLSSIKRVLLDLSDIKTQPQEDLSSCGVFVIRYAEDYMQQKNKLGIPLPCDSELRSYRIKLARRILRYALNCNEKKNCCFFCNEEPVDICRNCRQAFCSRHPNSILPQSRCIICHPGCVDDVINVDDIIQDLSLI